MAKIFKALSSPTRLQILNELRAGEQCVCNLQEAIDVPQNLLSHHLAVLRDSELVNSRKDGKWVYYSLNKKIIRQIQTFFPPLITAKSGKQHC